jgi:ankyrin repeat protein
MILFRDGASPLWIAAQMGYEDIVRLLLKAGAKVYRAFST